MDDLQPITTKQAAAKLRYMARLNYTPKIMAWHQLMDLADELDPEGDDTGPAVSGSVNEEIKP